MPHPINQPFSRNQYLYLTQFKIQVFTDTQYQQKLGSNIGKHYREASHGEMSPEFINSQ